MVLSSFDLKQMPEIMGVKSSQASQKEIIVILGTFDWVFDWVFSARKEIKTWNARARLPNYQDYLRL